MGDTWAGPQPAAPRPHSASPGPPGSPPPSPLGQGQGQAPSAAPRPLLSAAEVVTVVHLAAVKPRAVAAALPSQLQVRVGGGLRRLRWVGGEASLCNELCGIAWLPLPSELQVRGWESVAAQPVTS